MEKLVFDSFRPKEECFAPPPTNPLQLDKCSVEVAFHHRTKPEEPQAALHFQRERDHYTFSTQMNPATIAVVRDLGLKLESEEVQNALIVSVFLHGWHTRNYRSFKSAYNGPDLLPLTFKAVDFITSGGLQTPDPLQRKKMAEILREMLPIADKNSAPAKEWFVRNYKSLLGETNIKFVPASVRPRIQWLLDLTASYEDFQSDFSPLKNQETQKALEGWALSTLIYIHTGEGNWNSLKEEIDRISLQVLALPSLPENLKGLFATILSRMEAHKENSFFSKNGDAKKRMGEVHGFLKRAVEQHRMALLSLSSPTAFQKILTLQITEAAQKNHLTSRVRPELEEAHLPSDWLKENIEEIAGAVAPHLHLVMEPGQDPHVKVETKGIKESAHRLVKKHYIQEREYQIGVLAILRYLFDPQFNKTRLHLWVEGQPLEIEMNLSEADSTNLRRCAFSLNKRVAASVNQTNILLPIGEGALFAAGAGLTTYAHLKEGRERTPLALAGPAVAGLGGSALLCNTFLKTRNQYISDSLCGLIGGGLGLGVGFLTTQKGATDSSSPPQPPVQNPPITIAPPRATGVPAPQKPPPPIDGENPSKGYGP